MHRGNVVTATDPHQAVQRAQWAVVMGVSGCGKSTLAQCLADALQLPFIEGDDFHSPENKRKMTHGMALNDADRQGWLDALAHAMRQHSGGAILSCSALKLVYRERLRAALPGLRFIHIYITQEVANARVAARLAEHFFPPGMVASQFAALEDPTGEAGVLPLNGSHTPAELLALSLDWMATANA